MKPNTIKARHIRRSQKINPAPIHSTSNGAIRKMIVLGGSAGGIQSLCKVIEGLPPHFPAALLAVIHMFEGGSHLPEVLQRCGSTRVIVPDPAEPIASGRLYLPLPNHHLVVRNGCVATVMGPRESRHRPSVNTLFRCVARGYRSDVIAVVLSGALDDGSAGVMAVKARGGVVIVEDPSTAEVPDMPANAMRAVAADYCLPIQEIPAILSRLVVNGHALRRKPPSTRRQCAMHAEPVDRIIEPQGITCPDCGGYLAKIGKGKTQQFRCHVGHTFSLESLTEGHADALERALWIALRKLNEQQTIQQNLARVQSDPRMRKRFNENAAAASLDMEKLHEILSRL